MRWPACLIFGYITLGVQAGLARYLAIGSASPNFVVLMVIFIAMNAPRDAALLAAFGLGMFQDVLSQQPLGLCALSYGLVAMVVVGLQQVVYRRHPLTHFSLALFSSLLTMMVIVLHIVIRGPRLWSPIPSLFYSSLYTAVLAPIVLGLLGAISGAFAFQSSRRRT
ncbi:MAG TPA: rod shape-determining protein MreD [Tepidisphaeraceae bacterium]|nr:rod shape-determining protein MreD [Tepidisphaeraceae bacterium]